MSDKKFIWSNSLLGAFSSFLLKNAQEQKFQRFFGIINIHFLSHNLSIFVKFMIIQVLSQQKVCEITLTNTVESNGTFELTQMFRLYFLIILSIVGWFCDFIMEGPGHYMREDCATMYVKQYAKSCMVLLSLRTLIFSHENWAFSPFLKSKKRQNSGPSKISLSL